MGPLCVLNIIDAVMAGAAITLPIVTHLIKLKPLMVILTMPNKS